MDFLLSVSFWVPSYVIIKRVQPNEAKLLRHICLFIFISLIFSSSSLEVDSSCSLKYLLFNLYTIILGFVKFFFFFYSPIHPPFVE